MLFLLLHTPKARRTAVLGVLVFATFLAFLVFGAVRDQISLWSKPSVLPSHIIYKDEAKERPLAQRPFVPVKETFPLAAAAKGPEDLPPIPHWNKPPTNHVPESTPIFIGFTRNWMLLQQTVVSLLTAGWPAEDIYVVENTGVMDANLRGQLNLQNPFYLNHDRLKRLFGVNIIVTPSLQTFAQLQNFYLYEAIRNNWPQYFWAHMDIIVQSAEDVEPYESYYMKCVDAMRTSLQQERLEQRRWGLRYFAYDWVTLMNTASMVELGAWDTMISYYTTDCDLYERMRMAGFSTDVADAGPVYDSGKSFEDLAIFYRVGDVRGSETWNRTQETLKEGQRDKNRPGIRNRWQIEQMGGQGDPYYRDMDGFAEALEITVQAGIEVYGAKWHATGCGLRDQGLKLDDAWKVKKILPH